MPISCFFFFVTVRNKTVYVGLFRVVMTSVIRFWQKLL